MRFKDIIKESVRNWHDDTQDARRMTNRSLSGMKAAIARGLLDRSGAGRLLSGIGNSL